jgi:hypothetical protein
MIRPVSLNDAWPPFPNRPWDATLNFTSLRGDRHEDRAWWARASAAIHSQSVLLISHTEPRSMLRPLGRRYVSANC